MQIVLPLPTLLTNAGTTPSLQLAFASISQRCSLTSTTYENEGKITLVDLAGCERVKKSGAEAQALKEAQSINTSLSALGNVVSAVLSGQKHIPYRSNILTLLMSDTVGGNAKAQMFVNISPADYNAEESENSLTFAQRVKQVKNQSKAERDAEKMKIKLQKQVLELQKKLANKG